MAKRLTNEQKEEIINSFTLGKSIDDLSEIYKCNKATIIRNLKKTLGDKRFKELLNKNKTRSNLTKKKLVSEEIYLDINTKERNLSANEFSDDIISQGQFLEIAPIDYEIDNLPQKDLASVPIKDVDMPEIAYMIVDKKIELTIKYLKDYPEWQFLADDELKRKTIEIYFDLKVAKRFCSKDQKVLKVPNTNIFKLAAPMLLKKGISRIIGFDKLIAL